MKPTGKIPYLNLGCGYTFHEDWTNLDFVSNSPFVVAHNLLNGIPCDDATFEVVYHSHVLEHFPKDKAPIFLRECARVLKSGGTIRIAIPDLEQIAINYLKYLNAAAQGDQQSVFRYHWSVMEMYDQVVRTKSGGEMSAWLRNLRPEEAAFLIERNGKEIQDILDEMKNAPAHSTGTTYTLGQRLQSLPSSIKHRLLRLLMGEDYQLYTTAKFRSQGEIHQWMYDRFSLAELLSSCGFENPVVRTAFESAVPDWKKYGLDGDGTQVRKPDSLFMEATRK
ncbi:MAG: methyltransferase domain-containing protein [Flavobacteriales bacterium]|nr:methyltransferase domain-containing protein [Flavobacteriales bacterium]